VADGTLDASLDDGQLQRLAEVAKINYRSVGGGISGKQLLTRKHGRTAGGKQVAR